MYLDELIVMLRHANQDAVLKNGFTYPHSYRGYYSELAFEPAEDVKVSDMLRDAEGALGKTFMGYKGGDYTMHGAVECYLATYGNTGEELTIRLMTYMLKDTVEETR